MQNFEYIKLQHTDLLKKSEVPAIKISHEYPCGGYPKRELKKDSFQECILGKRGFSQSNQEAKGRSDSTLSDEVECAQSNDHSTDKRERR